AHLDEAAVEAVDRQRCLVDDVATGGEADLAAAVGIVAALGAHRRAAVDEDVAIGAQVEEAAGGTAVQVAGAHGAANGEVAAGADDEVTAGEVAVGEDAAGRRGGHRPGGFDDQQAA